MKNQKIIITAIILFLLIVVVYFFEKQNDRTTLHCTQEAKLCPDGSYVGRTGPKCEFAPCPDLPALPQGYGLENYTVEKVTGESCSQHNDCETPGEYLVQSRCPFVSLCLEKKCAVVCPGTE